MKELLYWVVGWITRIHHYILRLNDAFEYNFTDKELHFLIIGILGMGFIFAIYPVFKWLANRNHIMTITFIYAFTLIIVITFAIEIGQKVTNSGNMEFADIMMGVMGFVLMYTVFATVRQIWKAICKLIRGSQTPERRTHRASKLYEDEDEYEDADEDEDEVDFVEIDLSDCEDGSAERTELKDVDELARLERLIELEALEDED